MLYHLSCPSGAAPVKYENATMRGATALHPAVRVKGRTPKLDKKTRRKYFVDRMSNLIVKPRFRTHLYTTEGTHQRKSGSGAFNTSQTSSCATSSCAVRSDTHELVDVGENSKDGGAGGSTSCLPL